jgi:hypothetical protein
MERMSGLYRHGSSECNATHTNGSAFAHDFFSNSAQRPIFPMNTRTTFIRRSAILALAMLIFAMFRATAAQPDAPIDAKTAFAKLKSLSGQWTGYMDAKGHPATVTYRAVSNGSAILETEMPNTNHEMVTLYTLDGGDLVLTHYCMLGNQPRMKLDRQHSTASELVFRFDGAGNLRSRRDPHMHALRLDFRSRNKIEAAWTFYTNGKDAGTHIMHLARAGR